MKMKVALLLILTTFSIVSCGSNVPVKFNPDFFEFVTKEKGYIINADKTIKVYCDQPAIRKNYAAMSKSKIKELATILRNAKVPKSLKKKLKRLQKSFDLEVNRLEK